MKYLLILLVMSLGSSMNCQSEPKQLHMTYEQGNDLSGDSIKELYMLLDTVTLKCFESAGRFHIVGLKGKEESDYYKRNAGRFILIYDDKLDKIMFIGIIEDTGEIAKKYEVIYDDDDLIEEIISYQDS